MQVLQLFEEATPEEPGQYSDGEEEPWLARYPPLGIGREAATGYDAVHVRMMSQRGSPRVQNQGGADPSTQVLRVGGDRAQGLGGDIKQQTINNLLVGIGDGADGRRRLAAMAMGVRGSLAPESADGEDRLMCGTDAHAELDKFGGPRMC